MIDWNRVAEFRNEIGSDDFAEVVEIFLEEADEAITALGACSDQVELREKCHFLKGCALNLGFSDFGTLCSQGESKSTSLALSTSEIEGLIHSFKTSREVFLAGI